MKTNYELVREAIETKQHVTAEYKGLKREMCPHVIGTNDYGRTQALFYQFGGESSSGPILEGSTANWRCIPIDGLDNVSVQPGEWYTADNHSKTQSCVDNVDLEVEFERESQH